MKLKCLETLSGNIRGDVSPRFDSSLTPKEFYDFSHIFQDVEGRKPISSAKGKAGYTLGNNRKSLHHRTGRPLVGNVGDDLGVKGVSAAEVISRQK